MNLAVTVLEIVAPVFLLAAVGFTWVRLGFEYRIQFVTRLAMTLGVPCLVFVSLMEAQIEPAALTRLSLASVIAYGGVSIAVFLALALARLDMRTYLSPLIFGNTGNLGLPLALFAFGPEGLANAIVIFAIMAVWNFTFGLWVVSGGGSPGKVLKEPLVWASVLGGACLLSGYQTPVFFTETLRLIGQMAIPLMLITLGVAVARLAPEGIGRALVLSSVKLILCAGIAWLTADVLELDKVAFGTLVLQVATPVAVTSYLLAEKYGADAEAVAGLVVVSTLLSVAALPLLLALLL